MPAYRDMKTGTWTARFYKKNSAGKNVQINKRGFATKREALEYERVEKLKEVTSLTMPFSAFVEIYRSDMGSRLRENTWRIKDNVINDKLLPFFGNMPLCDIAPKDVIQWQNKMMTSLDNNGKPYSQTYLRVMHNQLSAILNHAVRFYDLRCNVAAKVGSMGKKQGGEMQFWTREEYMKFSEAIMDKPLSYYAFEVLYWCGIREGELFALTRSDFDLEKKTLSITKSLQRLSRRDILTPPKTDKGIRTIVMPDFLCEEMEEFFNSLYGLRDDDRLFPFTKSYMHNEMARGCKASGVKVIRIHDLRHSHISLLINMGFSAVAIGNRVGHESADITYRYAHMFPTEQTNMANRLNKERNDNYDTETNGQQKPLAEQTDLISDVPTGSGNA